MDNHDDKHQVRSVSELVYPQVIWRVHNRAEFVNMCVKIKFATDSHRLNVLAMIQTTTIKLFKCQAVQRNTHNSLWDNSQKGPKIESGRTPLIIRFLCTKTKITILATNLEGVTFVKIIRKG